MQNVKNRFIQILFAPLILLGAIVSLTGCSSTQPSRFYILTSASDLQTASNAVIEKTVGINIVSVPEFLERPQIVERVSDNQISMAEFDRWAGSLQANMARVLSSNIDGLVPQASTVAFPWSHRDKPTQEVKIKIEQFDGQVGGTVTLVASWTIHENDKALQPIAKNYTRSMDESSYATLAASMSELLTDLSKDIADSLQ